MGWRAVISLTSGKAGPEHWMGALDEEPRTKAKPSACDDCPLRKGGEWEANVANSLSRMGPKQRIRMRRWTCHAGRRPCAGMLRLVADAERGPVAPAESGPKETG